MNSGHIMSATETRRAAAGQPPCRLAHNGTQHGACAPRTLVTPLDIAAPDTDLKLGSGTQAEQTAQA